MSTAELRPPTGLDRGARMALLRLFWEAGHQTPSLIVGFFRRGSWGDLDDYLDSVDRLYETERLGAAIRNEMRALPQRNIDSSMLDFERAEREATAKYAPLALLLTMPEADFMTTLLAGIAATPDPFQATSLPGRINDVCAHRGVPFRVEGVGRVTQFKWVGDATVEQEAIQPALSALDDSRLRHGPREDFDSARTQLREGTPRARKLAVGEACSAVESALKVLLAEHGVDQPEQQHLDALVAACRDAGIFPTAVGGQGVPVEQILTAPGRVGNRRGRHGSGAVPHDVETDEAEAVVAAAAVALTLISRRLPRR